jgi:hypothetical protein
LDEHKEIKKVKFYECMQKRLKERKIHKKIWRKKTDHRNSFFFTKKNKIKEIVMHVVLHEKLSRRNYNIYWWCDTPKRWLWLFLV